MKIAIAKDGLYDCPYCGYSPLAVVEQKINVVRQCREYDHSTNNVNLKSDKLFVVVKSSPLIKLVTKRLLS